MCGIIGAASTKPSVDKLLIGLLRQEYQGYDSAGLAIFDEADRYRFLRALEKLQNFKAQLIKTQSMEMWA